MKLTEKDIRALIAAVKLIGIRGGMLAEGCSDEIVVHLASSPGDMEICIERWQRRPTN